MLEAVGREEVGDVGADLAQRDVVGGDSVVGGDDVVGREDALLTNGEEGGGGDGDSGEEHGEFEDEVEAVRVGGHGVTWEGA